MNQVSDRKKLRREFLNSKGFAFGKIVANTLLMIPALTGATMFSLAAIAWLLLKLQGEPRPLHFFIFEILVDTACIAATVTCARNIRRTGTTSAVEITVQTVAEADELAGIQTTTVATRRTPSATARTQGLVADRKYLRREYLRKKSGAYLKMTAWTVVMLPSLCVAGLSTIGTIVWLISSRQTKAPGDLSTFGCLCVLDTVSWLIAWWSIRTIIKTEQAADKLPYSPPFNVSTLPADEILVRGSGEPPVEQNEELLRAAQGVETPEEELLRVSQ